MWYNIVCQVFTNLPRARSWSFPLFFLTSPGPISEETLLPFFLFFQPPPSSLLKCFFLLELFLEKFCYYRNANTIFPYHVHYPSYYTLSLYLPPQSEPFSLFIVGLSTTTPSTALPFFSPLSFFPFPSSRGSHCLPIQSAIPPYIISFRLIVFFPPPMNLWLSHSLSIFSPPFLTPQCLPSKSQFHPCSLS